MVRNKVAVEYELKQAKARVAELEREVETISHLTVAQQIAEQLHTTLCRADHVTGCAWDYNTWDLVMGLPNIGNSNVRLRYLGMANFLLAALDDDQEQTEKVINVIYKFRE